MAIESKINQPASETLKSATQDVGCRLPMELAFHSPDTWYVRHFDHHFIITRKSDGEYGEEFIVASNKHYHKHTFNKFEDALIFCWRY